MLSEGYFGKINPVVLGLLADESQIPDLDASRLIKFRPALAGYPVSVLRLVLGPHLYYCEVRHIRPLFLIGYGVHIQPVVQLAHSVGGMGHPNKYGRGYGNKGFDFAQRNLERLDFLTELFHGLNRFGFRSLKKPWREQSYVCGEMRQVGVEFSAERFDELPHRVLHVGNKCITLSRHGESKL